jgi:SAM-dependent methyltransferase
MPGEDLRARFAYDAWPSLEPYRWDNTNRGDSPWDNLDFHVDLGCGKVKKARIGVDRFPAEGVNVVADLDAAGAGRDRFGWPEPGIVTYGIAPEAGADADLRGFEPGSGYHARPFLVGGLPFETGSIESIITHHALEHLSAPALIGLIDECYRVLVPGGVLRAIVPLFPSYSAVSDPDHKTYFLADETGSTFDTFCGTPGDTPQNCFHASFSVPYMRARFEKVDQDITARTPDATKWWTTEDARELRVALRAVKDEA